MNAAHCSRLWLLQWHVTPRALQQWTKYKAMVDDVAQLQQYTTKTAVSAASEKAEARHPSGSQLQQRMMKTAPEVSGHAKPSNLSSVKRKAGNEPADNDKGQTLPAKRTHLQHRGTSGLEAAKQSASVQNLTEILTDAEDAAAEQQCDLNDTVGAIVVDASGTVLLMHMH